MYENEIQGAFSSGDLTNGEEWIFVPSDINVSYYIGSHDVQKFLEENPDFNASNATIEFDATYMEYSPNTKHVQLPDGNWTISNRSVSDTQVETINPGEIKEIIFKDKTPPNIVTELTAMNGTSWINFTWTNPPDPDFNHTELHLNGTFLTNIPASQNYYNITGLLSDTLYELSTRTIDTSGNINETWVNTTARTLPLPDTTPPTITFTPPTDPNDTTLTTRNWTFINVSLSEPGFSWLEWNGTNESMSGSGTFWYINRTELDNGVYTYRVWANDSAGNVNDSETRAIEIDYVTDILPPVIIITSPVNDTTYNTDSIDLNYSVNEPTTWQGYSTDGAANITLLGNTTLTGFTDGLHILNVYANDTSGNMNSSTVSFTIDTTPPANITGLDNITYERTYINWTWTDPADVDFSKVMVYLDGTYMTDVLKGVRHYNATGLTPDTKYEIGTHTMDESGNINETWVNNTVRTAPTTTTIPTIEFTYVPPLGSFENLRGKVTNVTPSDYKVAVYIYVSGWWTKPNFTNPLTTIQSDGNWTCDITTGGSDQNATQIKAYLIPNSYTPPQMSGGQILPSELDQNAVASIEAIRKPERIIQFSGYNWTVKSGEILMMGPGPNYFSDSNENVWVDQQGQLHLKIVNRDGKWYCAEVYTTESLGYGKYIFYVASRVDQLDKNVVAGLFTWDGAAPEYNYREIDIEFSKWGQAINDNAQYVVQPWDQTENMERFKMELNGNNSTHIFNWSIDSIFFQSLHDHFSSPSDDSYVIKSWIYTGDDIPPAGEENVRINFWLNNGDSPSDGQEAEVIIKKFEYTQNDTTPPVITNIANTMLTTDSVTITWDTDEASDSIVKYGTTSGNYTNEEYNTTLVTLHSISLSNLSANTTYYYEVNSTDASGNTGESSEYNFTTAVISKNTTILIVDAIAAPNGYAFTSIMVNNVTDLGSGSITVTYNSSVVHVTNVTSGDGNALAVQDWNVDNSTGSVRIFAQDADESHNGDVVLAIVNFHAVGEYPDSTPLAISSSELIDYTSYGIIRHSVTNGIFSIIDIEPPVITDAIATLDVILNDNGRPRIPGTNVTVLNATVLDNGSGVVNVTINLSSIGGSDDQVMERMAGTDVWTVATTANEGINLTHELVVTATDGANNTNTSVIGLTVLLRGDVVRDGDLNSADALYIAKYLVGKEPRPSLLVSDMSPDIGDGKVTSADALYLAKYLVGKEVAP